MSRLLEQLGFSENPFSQYVAENEPHIDRYFVPPPYFSTLQSRSRSCHSHILFGARGAGKSATRIALYKDIWGGIASNKGGPLIVTLDTFSRILSNGLDKVTIQGFIQEIGYLAVEGILVWLATLSEEDKNTYIEGLKDEEHALVASILNRFYLTLPEHVRQMSASEAAKLLGQAWTSRVGQWVQNKTSVIGSLVGAIVQALFKKAGLDASVDKGIEQLISSMSGRSTDAPYARAVLQKLVEFAKIFGFSGIVILVDKVDETDQTTNSAESSAQLLFPILSNTQLLEIDGLGWMMFLWNKVKDYLSAGTYKVRLDKIAHAEITWAATYLYNLIDQRIAYFSSTKITTLKQLCSSGVNYSSLQESISAISQLSPRELIRVLDTIVREHENLHSESNPIPLLHQESIDKGLDAYAKESVTVVYLEQILRQVLMLNKVKFINKDVQTRFNTNENSARSRIKRWTDAGIVAQTGYRQSEGGVGGKPSFEYSIMDQRVCRIIDRDLMPLMQTEANSDDEASLEEVKTSDE